MDNWILTFWAMAAALVAVACLFLWRGLSRSGDVDPGTSDMAVYRDQLDEVSRDLARGVVTQDEAESMRTEIARRLLKADAREAQTSRSGSVWPLGAAVGLACLGAFALYSQRGAVGYGDMPLAARKAASQELRLTRPDQASAEQEAAPFLAPVVPDPKYSALVDDLRKVLETRPDDLKGLRLLAVAEARIGNLIAAHQAQAKIVELLGDKATAEDWATLAELRIAAADGYVSPEAEAALQQVLSRDPRHAPSRYAVAALYIQIGRPDLAFPIWKDLLEQGPETAPWIPPIRAQIEALAIDAGALNYEPPAPLRGPSAADIENAQGLSQADQMAMGRGMVAQLSERLATEGGSLPEWMQLIQALRALGQVERATAIYQEALGIFGGDPTAASRLLEMGDRLGLAQ